jgi:chemotaxis protein MotB
MIERLLRTRSSDNSEQYIWLTIYSDLITNLFLLYLSLYAFSFFGPDVIKTAVASMRSRLEYSQKTALPWYADITRHLKLTPDQKAAMVVREDRLQMALPEDVLFAPGQGELQSQDQLVLHALAQALQKLPYTVLVEGHTDNQPPGSSSRYASNWELSLTRAMSVVKYLVTYEGISPHRLGVAAFGEFHPRYPNDTPEHRALNRRIEISILRYE